MACESVVRPSGRVGRLVAEGAKRSGRALVIVEDQPDLARAAVEAGFSVVLGNATERYILGEAGIEEADKLLIAIPEGFEAGAIAARARQMNADVTIFARAHSDAEVDHLAKLGVDRVIMGEREIASRLIELLAKPRAKASA